VLNEILRLIDAHPIPVLIAVAVILFVVGCGALGLKTVVEANDSGAHREH